MEFEKCQQPTPTTYSEAHYGNREVSTPLGMDFAVSANAPVGLVLILTWNAATFTFDRYGNFDRYENREVSTSPRMDFAVSANAPVGLVLILTRECYHFYFLTGMKIEKCQHPFGWILP